jgi:hypothetical protein
MSASTFATPILSSSAGSVTESVDSEGDFISGNDTTLPDATPSVAFPERSAEGVHAIIRMKAQSIVRITDFCFTDAKVRIFSE